MAEYGKQTPPTPQSPAATSSRQGSQASQSTQHARSPQSSQSTQGTTKQKVTQATERVAEKAQSTFENARANVTEQLTAVSRAIEQATNTLAQEQQSGLSKKIEPYVEKAKSASQYLENKTPRELKDDLDQFARQRPAWFLGGAFVAGFFGARFLKSSAEKTEQKGAVEYGRV